MTNECDKRGLDDVECRCYLYEIEKRISELEKNIEKISSILDTILDGLEQL